MRAKLADQGKPAMFLGHVANHSPDVYRMLNLKTKRVIKTRDTLWLNETYGCHTKSVNSLKRSEAQNDDDDYEGPIQATSAGDIFIPDGFDFIPTVRDETADQTATRTATIVLTTEREDDEREEAIGGDTPEAQDLNPKVLRAMKKLGSFFNPEAQSLVDATDRPNAQEQAFDQSGRDNFPYGR
jgi:hypothetical protein